MKYRTQLQQTQSSLSGSDHARKRRTLLKGIAGGAVGFATLGAPTVFAKSKNVVVRGLGGAYQEAMDTAIYQPFTKETGIKVTVQPATAAQIRAMVAAKRVSVDVTDLLDISQLSLHSIGALSPINYNNMRFTDPDDIQPTVRHSHMVGNLYFATVLAYNTEVFERGSQPKSWAEFWDVERFPGARTLADQNSGAAELEFALLADGVAKEDLYPIDLDRAFLSLDKIKAHVSKWWDTGAVSAQLLERKEAVLGGIWNGRAQALIDKGAPLAIEWNQAKQQVQYWGVVKDSPNAENGQLFIDFALQPEVQGELTNHIAYGPTNKKAFDFVRAENMDKLPSAPDHFSASFEQDPQWWIDHLSEVGERWQSWILRRS